MFSDRYRTTKIIALTVALFLLAFHAHLNRKRSLIPAYRENPPDFIGREIPFHLEPKVVKVAPGRLWLRQLDDQAEIIIPEGFSGVIPDYLTVDDIEPGQYVEAVTVVNRRGDLELKKIRIAYLRRAKIAVSLLPALLVAVILILSVRREKGRLVMK